jgi:hypothetical protein
MWISSKTTATARNMFCIEVARIQQKLQYLLIQDATVRRQGRILD